MTDASDTGRMTAWLLDELPRVAPAWLAGQRWFGGKAYPVDSAAIEDVFWLGAGESTFALVILDVHQTDPHHERRDRYAVILGLRRQAERGAGDLGTVSGAAVFEASTNADALGALLGRFHTGQAAGGIRGGFLTFSDATDATALAVTTPPHGTLQAIPVGSDQSNTSVRIGTTHVFKLLRRLEAGEHPEIEIGRFLASTTFRAAPSLEGTITYVPHDGRPAALGVLQGWVDSVSDGWSYVLGALAHSDPDRPGDLGSLADALAVLGTTTARFHLAMASDPASAVFAPTPVTSQDRRHWQASLVTQFERVATVLHPSDRWSPRAAALAAQLLSAGFGAADRIRHIAAVGVSGDCRKLRIHGDFHLGQTLRTRDGFVLIDFEGEPARPLEERRRQYSALKDVAGMLRSIDYAIAAAGQARADRPGGQRALDSSVTGRLRRAFLEAYEACAAEGHADILPAGPTRVRAWTEFFELEKALYEVEYEANSRPSWLHIPLAAVVDRLSSSPPAR